MHPTSLSHALPFLQQKNASQNRITGVIEKKTDNEHYTVRSSAGTLSIKLNTDQLSVGDSVILSFTSSGLRLEKSGMQFDNVELTRQDEFTRGTLSNIKFADLLSSLHVSIQSGNEQVISENASTVLDFLKNSRTDSINIDKSRLSAVIRDVEHLLTQKENISDSTAKTLGNIVDILKAELSDRAENDAAINRIFQPSTPLSGGLYSVKTVTEAASLLDISDESGDLLNQIARIIDQYGKITFKISGNMISGFLASALTPDNLSQELRTLLNNLKSPLLQSLPMQSIKDVIDIKGNISESSMNDLDELMKGMTSRFPSERAGSRNAAAAAASNWLMASLDMLKSGISLAALTPVFGAQKIPDDINAINRLITSSSAQIKTTISEAGLTEDILLTNSRERIIQLSVSKLGLNLESSIAESTAPLPDNIKSQLLFLRNLATQARSSSISGLSSSVSLSDAGFPDRQIKQIYVNLDNIMKMNSLHNEIPAASGSRSISVIHSDLSEISDNLKSVNLFLSAQSIGATLTKELSGQLINLLKILDNPASVTFDNFTKLKTMIDSFLEQFQSGYAAKENLISVKDSLLPANLSNDLKSTAPGGLPPELQMKIREAVESSINRLESLQLLARQIPASDGQQQQMLALPLKIGDEWTELNIRFLKKDESSKKKHKAGSTFTVYLNLSPKNIGEVSVKMEYVQKKSLKIAFDFAQDSTKSYFQKYSDEIKNAISELGLPLFSIDIRKKTDKSDTTDKSSVEQLIDVKV